MQVNYLIDEACDTGKGTNTIVSLLHHFFQEHGLGMMDVHLHVDNCVGQNKCVLVRLNRSVILSFLVIRHTQHSSQIGD